MKEQEESEGQKKESAAGISALKNGFKERLPSKGRLIISIIGVILLYVVVQLTGMLFEHVGTDEIMVVVSPVQGKMTWHKTAGIKWQGWGQVTHYKKRSQFWFSAKSDQGKKDDESIKVRFNDGGHSNISGSIAWEMPLDDEHLIQLHTKYGSQHAIEQQLIRTVVEKAVYMTGPLMSSKESYAERRNDLLAYIEDQVQNGVYKTETQQEKQPDPMTGQMKTVNVVKLVLGKDGLVIRSDESPLKGFGIKTFNPSINEVKYDDTVEKQIQQQQQAIMQVQTAVAKAKEAEQAAITAEKNGQAEAAKAKWEQEVIKARAVTEAEQKVEVAKREKEAAGYKKVALILEGEGEAEKRKLIMSADGALDKKLQTYEKVMSVFAQEFSKQKWVPEVMFGGGQDHGGAGQVSTMMNLLSLQALKSLGLDLNIPEGRVIQPAAKKGK